MKKIILSLTLATLLMLPMLVLAQAAPGTAPNGTSDPDQKVTGEINKIFEIKKVPGTENLQSISQHITSNKESTYADLFAGIINILTGVAVVMTFVGMVVAGGIFVFSEGEEGRVTKARTIIIYVIIGDLIIAVSYAVVKSITLIKPLS